MAMARASRVSAAPMIALRWASEAASSSDAKVELARGLGARSAARLRMTWVGLARIVLGGVRAAYGRVRGSYRHRARGSRTVARGVGMVTGAWGLEYVEYRRVRGS